MATSSTGKSPLMAASPGNFQYQTNSAGLSRSNSGRDQHSYFPGEGAPPAASSYLQSQNHHLHQPQQQSHLQQQQQQQIASPDYDRTLSNTIANSNVASPLAAPLATRPTKFTEEWDATQRGSSIIDAGSGTMQRSNSFSGGSTTAGEGSAAALGRGNTLKKKASLRRGGSLKRSSSRRSMKAGSVRSLALQSNTDQDEIHSAFFCPVPTTGNPTEALANRFQSWRKILKDLITYFREIQTHYEQRSKSLVKLANVLNNTTMPAGFLPSGGLDDALQVLRSYNKQTIVEANKAKEIEEDVILALTGLRSDLHQKIKEIKSLSGDFKNSVEKEMEATRRAVNQLQEALGQTELDSALTTGKQDPYLLRLAVDRQLERQLDEENYLHQAYLNIENSGRELEAIVVGEIQKSYNAYAGILKRESDAAYGAIEELRVGPIAMPKDHEWTAFVRNDAQFVDPEIPIRSAEFIHYPGKDHYASQEIRAGLLERKSKYLKSYTAGWYVLSPTHLHEFKSADKTQAPVMSLYLPEQKLGSHSTEGGSSNKFILKGRQTGTLHRGHTWVFRAESHDTMMAWYEDIKALTEKSPEERSNFVRGHTRSYSRSSQRSISSDGAVDDDEDEEPFSASASINPQPRQDAPPRRPEPGGRFPSDLEVGVERGLQVGPLSPSSVSSDFARGPQLQQPQSHEGDQYQQYQQEQYRDHDYDVVAAAGALPGGGSRDAHFNYGNTSRTHIEEVPSRAAAVSQEAAVDGINPYTHQPIPQLASPGYGTHQAPEVVSQRFVTNQSLNPAHGGVSRAVAEPSAYGGEVTNGSALASPNYTASSSVLSSDSGLADGPFSTDGRGPVPTGLAAVDAGPRRPAQQVPAAMSKQTAVNGNAVRPGVGTRTDSVPASISGLHIPGEYPKATPLA